MRTLDWVVMFAWLVFLVSYGLWRGRGSSSTDQFMLAGKTMPWYAMGLSIMATQASAITFISTTAQAYVDGMRFVQFYFGLPLAMVILSATAVPIFHRAKVFTAYEYLEHRFDAKTRLLVTIIFLISRGLGAGLALSAPAIVLSVVLGWPFRVTILIMGGLVVLYTTLGGIKAVTWADVQQMAVIMLALVMAFAVAISMLPPDVSFFDALKLAGAAGKLNAVTTTFDWNDRYNIWSGLIGGMFLALAYFGTDQSQVQRYLTGKSIGQSRLGLLLNAMAKVPIQFFILFIGAMVFVVFLFVRPPLVFQPVVMEQVQASPQYASIEGRYEQAFDQRQTAARRILASDDPAALRDFRAAQANLDAARGDALKLSGTSDTNYIFLSFVTHYLPVGIVGLLIAVIFTAAMSAISGEINSLATVTVIDIYKRHMVKEGLDSHYLNASRMATVFWGIYAMVFASTATGFGALIEAVNQVGSLFYGGMLGVFVLAFFVKRCTSTGAFVGVLAGEAAIFTTAQFTEAFLWYNVVGCGITVSVGWLLSTASPLNWRPMPASPSEILPPK
jgi:SSS family transporter